MYFLFEFHSCVSGLVVLLLHHHYDPRGMSNGFCRLSGDKFRFCLSSSVLTNG